MEQIDNKLNLNNPVLTAQIFSRLVENITEKNGGKREFAYLKSKCLGENSAISDAARASITKLIESGIFQVDQILPEFFTSISICGNVTSLTKTLMDLLYLQLSQKSQSIEQLELKSLQLMQHPIIKILQNNNDHSIHMCIYNEIIYRCYKDSSSLVHTLYKPLYLYCICSPIVNVELSLLRQKLWSFLIKCDDTTLIFKIICWMQMNEMTSSLLDELIQIHSEFDYVILTQILVVYNMASSNSDCRLIIKTLLDILPRVSFNHSNLALLILSKAVQVCSPLYLKDVLQLCFYFANQKVCQQYSFLALKSVLLNWLAGPCFLTQGALKIAEDILRLNVRERPAVLASRLNIDKFHFLVFCNPELLLVMELGIKAECTEIDTILEDFEEAPVHFVKTCFSFVCGTLLRPKLSVNTKLKAFSLILKCSSHYLEFLPTVLTLILHLLSNCDDNRMYFELLKALPVTAKVKENVPKILATLQIISKQSAALNNLALRLMYDAWEIDNKCYSALETIALQSPTTNIKEELFEHNVSRAYIFMKLSETRPEVYGKDLVAYLSNILNECPTADGAVPSALAIEGIRHLCKAEVIDIVTTWATLSPKFKEDTRVPVIKSLCKLLSEIPNLVYTQFDELLNEQVVRYLWSLVTGNDKEEVIGAALDALSAFSLNLICLYIPDEYLENSAKQNAVSGSNHVVPGKTWLKFLTTCKPRSAATDFLIKLVTTEIKNYLKYVYQVKSQREPENFGALPTHSIVRALGEFVKRNFLRNTTENEALFVDCMAILSAKYPKPLPPQDWCFLQELLHVPSLKEYCLNLASRQAILSGSARRLMENYIVAATQATFAPEESIHIYRNLKYLANSIQPMVLRPFFENTLWYAGRDRNPYFEEVLDCLREVLEDDDVQDVNKNVIEEVVTELVFISNVSSEIFRWCLNCISSFSHKAQEKLTRFDTQAFNEREFLITTKIRCHIAKHAKSDALLQWLNDIFETAWKNNISLDRCFIEDVTSTLTKHINHKESPTWLNELFGQIQVKVADRCEPAEIEFFCHVLTLVVVHFSGLFVVLPKYDIDSVKYFFPAALAFLIDEPRWNWYTVQVLEWLRHMNTAESVPKEFQRIFGWALCSLRHQQEFSKHSRWMRYLDCNIYCNK